jgi:16S rRNA (guanine527-N7)-methyltransferase
MEIQVGEFRNALRKHGPRYGVVLTADDVTRLCDFYELLQGWNPRLHLVAPCSPQKFAQRHVLESLLLLPHLPAEARIADIGSGAGLPIIPVLILRPDVRATLIESSQKKSVFLREALHAVGVSTQATVLAERFEGLPTPAADFITCRALDRFSELFPRLVQWSAQTATLLFFGGEAFGKLIADAGLKFTAQLAPESEQRWLFVIRQND